MIRTALKVLSICTLGMAASQSAFAAGEFDYFQSTTSVPIAGEDFAHTTSLGTVIATCPQDGYLHIQGSAGILLAPVPGDTSGVVQGGISLTRDNSEPYAGDPKHTNSLVFNTVGHNSAVPAFIQRIDTCKAGQSIKYRFVAWHEFAGDGSYAMQPRMVVQFFGEPRI